MAVVAQDAGSRVHPEFAVGLAQRTFASVLGIQREPPDRGEPALGERRSDYLTPGTAAGPIDYLLREAQNRSLGDAGETLVMDYERVRLERAGKGHLARNVEQVSRTRGDHMGYDIRSYEASGRDRFIEVKTTRYGKHTQPRRTRETPSISGLTCILVLPVGRPPESLPPRCSLRQQVCLRHAFAPIDSPRHRAPSTRRPDDKRS